jgi:hypothetical protein
LSAGGAPPLALAPQWPPEPELAEDEQDNKHDAAAAGLSSPRALETTGGHGASTATVNCLFDKQLRDSGLSADVLVGKVKKDMSFALRRGTIA